MDLIKSEQILFWKGEFGKEYTDRNTLDFNEWNAVFTKRFGISRLQLNNKFIGHFNRNIKILEVGCNSAMQLRGLSEMGFNNLTGIDLQAYAIEKAKQHAPNANLMVASAFNMPFKDNSFGLVFTAGVLIHTAPENLNALISEIYRCSSEYILGFEYFSDEIKEIPYRGFNGFMWKADYAKIFMERFPDLELVKKDLLPYIQKEEKGNIDCMFLLKKRN